MSAMAKMFADLILKEIPPEIREAITPENLTRIQENVQNTLAFYKGALEHIIKEQQEQREILERIALNVGNSNSGKPARGAGKLLGNGGGTRPENGDGGD